MRGMLAVVLAEDVNPATKRPVPLSGIVFTVLAVALALLLVSMVRHLRRAQANLGPAPPTAPSGTAPDPTGAPPPSGTPEADDRS